MIANFVSGAANRAGDRRQPPTSAPHGTNIAGMPAPGEGFENRRRTLARPIVEGERESPASRVSAIGIAPDAVRPEAQDHPCERNKTSAFPNRGAIRNGVAQRPPALNCSKSRPLSWFESKRLRFKRGCRPHCRTPPVQRPSCRRRIRSRQPGPREPQSSREPAHGFRPTRTRAPLR